MSSLTAIGTPEQRQALTGGQAALRLLRFRPRRLGTQEAEGVERRLGGLDPLEVESSSSTGPTSPAASDSAWSARPGAGVLTAGSISESYQNY